MWPDAVVLPELVRRQRKGRLVASVAACIAGMALIFSVFVFFAGLSSEELGVLRVGILLGIVSCIVGSSLLWLALRRWRGARQELRLAAAVLAGATFDLRDLAARLRCSEARAEQLVAAGRRAGWLRCIGHGMSYGPPPTRSNQTRSSAIKRPVR
jgi:hypothetical protein